MNEKSLGGPTEDETANGFLYLITRLRVANAEKRLTLTRLFAAVGPKGHAFLCLFLCTPFAQPIPLPGLSTPFGAALIVLGILQVRGRPPGLPDRWGRLGIDQSLVLKICSILEKVSGLLKRVVRPRLRHLFRFRALAILGGTLVIVNGFLLSLPLPIPFSNNLPALSIMLLSLGLIEEDIASFCAGLLMTLVTLVFFTLLVVLPYFALRAVSG